MKNCFILKTHESQECNGIIKQNCHQWLISAPCVNDKDKVQYAARAIDLPFYDQRLEDEPGQVGIQAPYALRMVMWEKTRVVVKVLTLFLTVKYNKKKRTMIYTLF